MKDKTKVAPTVTPHKYTPEEFIQGYNDWCKKTGFVISFEPKWIQSKDTGDYRLVIVSGVIPFKQDNANGSN